MIKKMICPACGRENDDNWLLKINNEIMIGGCQECWEAECSEEWWKMVASL